MRHEEFYLREQSRRCKRVSAALEKYLETGSAADRERWRLTEAELAAPMPPFQVKKRPDLDRCEIDETFLSGVLALWEFRGARNPYDYARKLKVEGCPLRVVLAMWTSHFPDEYFEQVVAYPMKLERFKKLSKSYDPSWLRPVYDKDHFRGSVLEGEISLEFGWRE